MKFIFSNNPFHGFTNLPSLVHVKIVVAVVVGGGGEGEGEGETM